MPNNVITMSFENVSYEITEINKNNSEVDLTEIINTLDNAISDNEDSDVEMDEYIELEGHYTEIYTLKDLQRICDYYNISRRKLRKPETIQEIVIFECDPTNSEIVIKRKLLWFYLSEIQNDNFLKKFVILE